MSPGPIALVGGEEWTDGCTFDAELLAASGTGEVVVLPTAAAYEHPERAVARAEAWFGALGAKVRPLMVLRRADADETAAAAVRDSRFVYLCGGSPMHLRSVLKETPVWDALAAVWDAGGVVAGSEAGGQVLTDPMVDPRGGAFTLGLGLVAQVAIVPHHDHWSEDKARRTIGLAPSGVAVVGIDDRTALIREPDGAWRVSGAGEVVVFRDGQPVGLDVLP